jgi:glycosyltransferase involved in cell wall biosynthesis
VGRLEPIKNHLLLLEAFRGLPSDLQGSLTILGEGSLRPLLAERIVELGLGDRVQMPGFVTDPEDTLRASDVFVLSSDFEGHPRVLIEALLCGLRIVATDCPTGPREILEGVAGALLVPPGDALALRAGMVQMAQAALSGTRARSSEQTAALVERFDPSAMARRYASLVSQVLG